MIVGPRGGIYDSWTAGFGSMIVGPRVRIYDSWTAGWDL